LFLGEVLCVVVGDGLVAVRVHVSLHQLAKVLNVNPAVRITEYILG
jgi:hypothetical protein